MRPNRFIALWLSLLVAALLGAPAAAAPGSADEAAVWCGAPAAPDASSDEAFLIADLDATDLDDDDLDPDEDALPAAAARMRACRAITPLASRLSVADAPERAPSSVFRPPRA